jgi:hypothetical protein
MSLAQQGMHLAIGVQLADWHVLSENCLVVSNFISSSQKGKLQKKAIFLMLNILGFLQVFPIPQKMSEMPTRTSKWLPSSRPRFSGKQPIEFDASPMKNMMMSSSQLVYRGLWPPKIAATVFFFRFFPSKLSNPTGRSQVDLLPQLVHRLSS